MKILEYIKKNYLLIAIVLLIGIFAGSLFAGSSEEKQENSKEEQKTEEATTWTCSMHPQIKQDKPGLCPICAMDLIPLKKNQSGGEAVDPNEIAMSEAAIQLASIQTTVVRKGVAEKNIRLQGKLQIDERKQSGITARFAGRIEKLYVNYTGQVVQKGQKLASIYSPDLVSAQRELLEAMAMKEKHPALYKAARSKLRLWDLSEKQIQSIEKSARVLEIFDVLAPNAGTVQMRHVAEGDYVKKGSHLFELADLSKLWVMLDAYEGDLAWISAGDQIDMEVEALPGKKYSAKITYIDPVIDAQSRVAKIRAELKNSKNLLKPEMFVKANLQSKIAAKEEQLLIPQSAVLWTGKRSVVYVKVPERETPSFLYRQIVLGPKTSAFYVVEDGLQAGEEIASNGVFKIDAAAQLIGLPSMMNPKGGAMSGHNHGMEQTMASGEHTSFPVNGNCEMCKETIETAAMSVEGVYKANWDKEAKVLHVEYDAKVDVKAIHKAVANSGYDTSLERAADGTYESLPGCCHYDRSTMKIESKKSMSAHHHGMKQKMESKAHTSFPVNGNCDMCKETIETAAMSVEGVHKANWDKEAKVLHVDYDAKVDVKAIHKAVANSGYDTSLERAADDVYGNLHGCCQYDRDALK
jgi:Cu(I)/Ag(I) efflux system membrane fusion protein